MYRTNQRSPSAVIIITSLHHAERNEMDIEAAIRKGGLALGFPELKAKQVEAMSSFLKGKDTFVSLPTGYGKSIIFAALPLAYDYLKGMYTLDRGGCRPKPLLVVLLCFCLRHCRYHRQHCSLHQSSHFINDRPAS